jgi:hypothetical protein
MEKLWFVVNKIEMKLITPIAIEIDVGVRTLHALGARSIINWGKIYNLCLTTIVFG